MAFDPRSDALQKFRNKLLQHKELSARVKAQRENTKVLEKQHQKSEDDLKALQSVGQIVGEVLRQLTEDKCSCCLLHARNHQRTGAPVPHSPYRSDSRRGPFARPLTRLVSLHSHREGIQWPATRSRMPPAG